MPLTPINVGNLGILGIDCSPLIDKVQRGLAVMQFGMINPEENDTEEDWQLSNPGDFENAFFWAHEPNAAGTMPRGVIGAWSFAMPAFAIRKQQTSGVVTVGLKSQQGQLVSGTPYWRPLERPHWLDNDFTERTDVTEATFAYGGSKIPGRSEAILVATTGHGTRNLMAFHPGGPIVAQHEGPDQPQYSRHVFDIDKDGNLDQVRHAGHHGPFHVRAWVDSYCQLKGMGPAPAVQGKGKTAVPPKPVVPMIPPTNSSYAVLFNGSGAADSSGYLGTHFSDAEAVESKERGGPLWRSQQRHRHGVTSDQFDVRGGAMWMDMLLNAGDDAHDAPWNWEKEFYEPATDGTYAYKVHFRINKNLTHTWCGEELPDRWDWEVFLPVMEWPPCNSSHPTVPGTDDPKDTFPPNPAVGALTSAQFSGVMFQPRAGLLAGGPKKPLVYRAP